MVDLQNSCSDFGLATAPCRFLCPSFLNFLLYNDTEGDNRLEYVNNSIVNTFHRNILYITVCSRIIIINNAPTNCFDKPWINHWRSLEIASWHSKVLQPYIQCCYNIILQKKQLSTVDYSDIIVLHAQKLHHGIVRYYSHTI